MTSRDTDRGTSDGSSTSSRRRVRASDARRQQLQEDANAERELAELAANDADLLLLSDYIARALSAESMAQVEARMTHDAEFHALATTLVAAHDAMRAHVDKVMDDAMSETDEAWEGVRRRRATELLIERTARERRRDERNGRSRDAAEERAAPRRSTARLVRRGALVVAALVSIGIGGALGWWLVSNPASEQGHWAVHRSTPNHASVFVPLSEDMYVAGTGSAFIAVRRVGLLNTRVAYEDVQDVWAEGALVTVSVKPRDGRELQLTTPLFTLRTRDGVVNILRQAGGGRSITVDEGRVVVELDRNSRHNIAIAKGEELAITADGRVDPTPPRAMTGNRRVPVVVEGQ